jgi:hypothetical protein
MVPSRRELLTGIAMSLAAPATLRAEGGPIIAVAGEGRTISARIRLPSGLWKRFSCSFPNGHPVARDVALACVRERNGVNASAIVDLTIV